MCAVYLHYSLIVDTLSTWWSGNFEKSTIHSIKLCFEKQYADGDNLSQFIKAVFRNENGKSTKVFLSQVNIFCWWK